MATAVFPMLLLLQPAFASISLLVIISSSCSKFAFASSHECFESITSFGDSTVDTGNAADLLSKSDEAPFFMTPPYGQTFLGHPTGRCSDGRLIIDFIAQELGLPYVSPFHGKESSDDSVNFAVVGATALNDSFFQEMGLAVSIANTSLAAQFSWFKEFLFKHCHHTSSECRRFLQSSLVLVGEIGGNDYNYAFFGGKSEAEVKLFVPQIIKTIGSTINELISLGAVTLMVPGQFPIGCSAVYLTYFYSDNESDYDSDTGCMKWLNKFAQYHNELLQMELNKIQRLHPGTSIIYADSYNAAIDIYRSPEKYGFVEGALKACCGGRGRYNMNLEVRCGNSESATCADPSLYMNWDGLHFTEAAHKWIVGALFKGSNITQLSAVCVSRSSTNASSY